MKIVDRVNRRFSIGAEVKQAVYKKFAVEAGAELTIFTVVGLIQFNEVTWVVGLDTRVDRVDDRVDIQIEIVLD